MLSPLIQLSDLESSTLLNLALVYPWLYFGDVE